MDNPLIPTPPPAPTPLEAAFAEFQSNNLELYDFIVPCTDQNYQLMWNPQGYTTADFLARLGTSALKVFTAAVLLGQVRQIIDPTYVIPPATQPVTFNDDGSAVLSPVVDAPVDITPVDTQTP